MKVNGIAMEQAGLVNSRLCQSIVTLSVLNVGMSVGYALTSFNPLTLVFQDIFNETYQARHGEAMPNSLWITLLSLIAPLLLAGAFCGSLSVTAVLKYLTARQAMVFWSVFDMVGAVIIAAVGGSTGSYEAIIVGRFVMGFGLGIGLNIGPMIVAEYSVKKSQGMYQSMQGMAIPIGEVISVILAHPQVLGTKTLWPAVAALSCVLSIFFICVSPWIPDSPRTLLRRRNREEAIKVMRTMRNGDEGQILGEISEAEEELGIGTTEDEGPGMLGLMEILRKTQYMRQLVLVIMVYAGTMLVGINHALLFSDRIFISAGIPQNMVTNATIGVFALQAVAGLIGMKILTVVSSKKLILGCLIVTCVSHVITTASIATQHLSAAAGYVAIVGILLLLISVAGGPNLAIWAIAGDVTLENTRATILKYAGASFWFSAWLTGFVAPYLDTAIGAYAFLVWLGFTIIFFIIVFMFIPDTKGKTSDEIQLMIMGQSLNKVNGVNHTEELTV